MNEAGVERFIEALGMRLELEVGTPRMVGRVLAWLLVCEPPQQSAAELADRLDASKGSISTATRILVRLGLIDRVRLRGERFDRFEVRPGAWDDFLWREEQFKEPRDVLRIGLDALADEPPERRARLEELDWMYGWWQARIGQLHEEYLADRERQRDQKQKRGKR